jgi:hypothetical protein
MNFVSAEVLFVPSNRNACWGLYEYLACIGEHFSIGGNAEC